MTHCVLIIDDDPKLRYILKLNLVAAGFETHEAADGYRGLEEAKVRQPDVVILDVMMPQLSGFEVCRTLREEPGYPDCSVLLLTARGELDDKGRGFAAGADDYLTKPFDIAELLWRTQALTRRLRRPHLPTAPLSAGPLRLHPDTLSVEGVGEEPVQLTRSEFTLLQTLAESYGRVVPSETLQRRCWGEVSSEAAAALRVQINRLRQRLEDDPATPRRLRTLRGRGYLLAD